MFHGISSISNGSWIRLLESQEDLLLVLLGMPLMFFHKSRYLGFE